MTDAGTGGPSRPSDPRRTASRQDRRAAHGTGVRTKPELRTIDTTHPAIPRDDADEHTVRPLALDEADPAKFPLAEDLAGDAEPDAAGEPGDLAAESLAIDDVAAEDLTAEDLVAEDLVAGDDLEADLATADDDQPVDEEEEDEGPPVTNRVAPRMPGHMPGVPNRPIMHARMPAKAEIFVEGDHVVYPTHGVGKVERIATEEIAGHRLELIHITFEENRMTLRVPVAKARSAGLRKLATRKMFDDAMAVLKGRARIKRTMWSRRAQEYEAKINSGDPIAIAEVVRDLHRNAGQPDQSFSERQIYEAAMDRLAAELAALDKTDKATAVTKLGEFLKTV